MGQKFSNLVVMEAVNHSKNSAMEAENHAKHGASSKSLMSRMNFLRKTCAFAGALMLVILTACGGGSSGSSWNIKMTTEAGGKVGFLLSGSGVAIVDWGDGSDKVTLTLNENELNHSLLPGVHVNKRGVLFEHTYPTATIRTITIKGNNITGLDCSNITSLDMSKNRVLAITSLDVSKNTALTRLNVGGNLTSIDVSKCAALIELGVHGNLTSLDVSKNTTLVTLDYSSNQLTSLDLSNNTALTTLDCRHNQLMSLDVSKNTALTTLDCSHNQLTSLDLSNNTALTTLYGNHNQLTAAALNTLFGTLHSNPISRKEIAIGYNNPGTGTCDRSIAERKGWRVW